MFLFMGDGVGGAEGGSLSPSLVYYIVSIRAFGEEKYFLMLTRGIMLSISHSSYATLSTFPSLYSFLQRIETYFDIIIIIIIMNNFFYFKYIILK